MKSTSSAMPKEMVARSKGLSAPWARTNAMLGFKSSERGHHTVANVTIQLPCRFNAYTVTIQLRCRFNALYSYDTVTMQVQCIYSYEAGSMHYTVTIQLPCRFSVYTVRIQL